MIDVSAFKSGFTPRGDGFRLLEAADSALLFRWRNGDSVRPFMRHTDPISRADHERWLEKTLRSERDLYFVYEKESRPLGLVCFNDISLEEKTASWGFYLGDPARFKGEGTPMMQKAVRLAFEALGLEEITAFVRSNNPQSLRLHLKLGFKMLEAEDGFIFTKQKGQTHV